FGEVRGGSITLSRATDNSPDALAQARIERVANSLTEKVVGEHRHEDREAGIGREPPADLDRVLALVQDVAPGRVRRLHAEPEEREAGLGEDRGGGGEGDGAQHGGGRGWKEGGTDGKEGGGGGRIRRSEEHARVS